MSRIIISLLFFISFIFSQEFIEGRIYDKEIKNGKVPLAGANLIWQGSSTGTTSDLSGAFKLKYLKQYKQLIVSYIGYKSDTLNIDKAGKIEIFLEQNSVTISNVNIVAEQKSMEKDYKGIENSTIITKKELQKAACCNLSESFETNPSIDVSFTDAITGTKQIEMLGLSGIYTQNTMENLPYLRGLMSTIGLTFLPGPWIHSLNVSKGAGSVANGYESVTGQIDIEMQKPADLMEKPLFLNFYGDMDERFEGNLNFAHFLGNNISFITFLHASSRQKKIDMNQDNFLDIPKIKAFNFMQRWLMAFENGWESRFGFQIYDDKREGGKPDNKPKAYIYNSENQNINIYGKSGYVFQDESGRSFGFQWSLNKYSTSSAFGTKKYKGEQKTAYFNFLYQSDFGNSHHTFRTGVSYNFDQFNETFNEKNYDRIERVPGAFFEYTFKPDEYFSAIAGIRYDNHNFYGNMITPRIHLRYALNDDFVIRAVAGRGFRTSNIFSEYASNFASSRELEIGKINDYGYGLSQETGWNYGLNLTYYFVFDYRDASFSIDLYRTDFDKINLANLDSDSRKIKITPVNNGAYSNSIQAELSLKPFENIDLRTAYRYLDVKQLLDGEWKLKPFTSEHRAFVNIAYTTKTESESGSQMLYDLTVQWFGKKRIPSTILSPVEYRRDEYSPDFFIVNAQITRKFNSSFDLYIGGENLLDYRQKDPIISSNDTDNKYFDASMIWGPTSGRMIYAGIRYSL